MKRKRPPEAAKSADKGKAKPAPAKRRGGPPAVTAKASAEREAQRQAAKAECDALAAVIEQRDIELKNPETHRTTQAFGRRALKALVIQYAGYSLAADVAGGDGHLEISLEALAIWLQEGVEVDGERVPRWQTMPAGSFHHLQRKPHKRLRKGRTKTVVQNASEVRLKTAGEEWLWRELARSAFEDAETAKVLHHLLGWHQDAAERFVERFLSARHSVQAGTRERLIEAATAMVSGDKDRVAVTTKEDRQRIIQDHPPAPVITSVESQSGKVGNPFSYQITAILDPTSFAAEDLPIGLRIDLRTGLISGTPKVHGKFKVTIAATNAGGTGKARLNISISPTPRNA